jgi:hypothetical protein
MAMRVLWIKGGTMTITQACEHVTSTASKRSVQRTIDRTGRRDAIKAIEDKIRQNDEHALLQKIRNDKKMKASEKAALLEATIRDIAIRQQYDIDKPFAKAVNADLAS